MPHDFHGCLHVLRRDRDVLFVQLQHPLPFLVRIDAGARRDRHDVTGHRRISMAVVDIRHHSERKVSAGGRSEHRSILSLIVLQHNPVGLMDHLISPGQRIVRAKRIIGNEHIQPCFFSESKRFLYGTGSWRRYHPAADQEEVGLIYLFPVD